MALLLSRRSSCPDVVKQLLSCVDTAWRGAARHGQTSSELSALFSHEDFGQPCSSHARGEREVLGEAESYPVSWAAVIEGRKEFLLLALDPPQPSGCSSRGVLWGAVLVLFTWHLTLTWGHTSYTVLGTQERTRMPISFYLFLEFHLFMNCL